MTARTDTHRPSAIDPSEYTAIGWQYHGPSDFDQAMASAFERERIRAWMLNQGATWDRPSAGPCAVCGNSSVLDMVVFHHRPSNTCISVGWICAKKMGVADGEAKFYYGQAKSSREAYEKARAGKLKAQGTLEHLGMAGAWAWYEAWQEGEGLSEDRRQTWRMGTLSDMISKLVAYGSWSPKQESFARKLWSEIESFDPEAARREAEAEAARKAAVVIEEGRQEIEGRVVSWKQDESRFGSVTKMLVERADGARFWGTCPTGCWCVAGEDMVRLGGGARLTISGTDHCLKEIKEGSCRFRATVKVSDRDSSFAFFSRPASFEWVELPPRAESEIEEDIHFYRSHAAQLRALVEAGKVDSSTGKPFDDHLAETERKLAAAEAELEAR